MIKKIKVEVFGIKNQAAGSGCSCSGGCGPTETMGEMYDTFVDFMSKSTLKDNLDIKFIDVFMDDFVDNYQYVIDAMNKGLGLPLTAVNGDLKFYGGLAGEMMFDQLKDLA